MKLPRTIYALIMLVIVFSTVGCDRIASIAPVSAPATATPAAVNFPVGEQADVTATAIAAAVGTQVGDISKAASGVVAKDGSTTETPATAAPTATSTPKPTATAVPATAVPSTPEFYTLQRGEWAICIARRYDLDLNEFFFINRIGMNTNYLPEGYVLRLSPSGRWNNYYGPRAWHAHPGTYYVQPYDTLNKIACFFGDVTPEAIASANGLSAGNYYLNPGQKLNIP
jgi:hypothetical protein